MSDEVVAQPDVVSYGFETIVPMPYRVLGLLNLGIWLWNANLRVFSAYRIDLPQVLHFTHSDVTIRTMQTRLATVLYRVTTANTANYVLYLMAVMTDSQFGFAEYLPLFGIVLTSASLLFPALITGGQDCPEAERYRSTVKRVSHGDIDIRMRTNDILVADTVTSYSRVLVDLFTYISALCLGARTLPLDGKDISRNHIQIYNFDLLLSYYPSVVRLLQCVKEYQSSAGKQKKPLFNAIKYSTAILPIMANVALRSGITTTFSAWYLGCLINSTYSFYWDITNDWELGLLQGAGFRRRTYYAPQGYYAALVVDLLLRYIWVWRLFYPSLLDPQASGYIAYIGSCLWNTEAGTLALETLEIVRRWIWIFFKVEAQYAIVDTSIPLRKA